MARIISSRKKYVPDKGPLQFEIDEQLNTTWYKE